jgi:endonuclease YncB( thermonuclease family)
MNLLLLISILAGPRYSATLIKCHDGDTCDLVVQLSTTVTKEYGGDVEVTVVKRLPYAKVRLCEIDTPELSTGVPGATSRDSLLAKLKAATKIEWEPSIKNGVEQREKYARWLGWIWADGVELNAWLVQNNLAVLYSEKCARAL